MAQGPGALPHARCHRNPCGDPLARVSWRHSRVWLAPRHARGACRGGGMTPLFWPGRAPCCKPSAHSGNTKGSRKVPWRSMLVRPVRCVPQPAAAFGGQQRAAPAAFLPSTPNPAAPNCWNRWVVKSSTLRRTPREKGCLARVGEDACSPRKPGGASGLQSSDSPRPSIRLIHALEYSKALKIRPSLSMIHIDAHPFRNFQSSGVRPSLL